MGTGDGQFKRIFAVNADGTASPLAKLYHYEAGTAVLKNIYSDAAMTSALAQPFISDARGIFEFFADGDYKFVIDDANDVTLDAGLDDFEITQDKTTMPADYHGTSLPSVGDSKKFQIFAKHDVSGNIDSLHILQGPDGSTAWQSFWSGSTTDVFINVKDATYGAVGDGIADDTTAIQAAFTAAALLVSGGIVFFPAGIYKITTKITISNTPIMVLGAGIDVSVIVNKNDTNGIFDYDTNDVKDAFNIENITLATDQIGGGDAINCTWPATATSTIKNFNANNVSIVPFRGEEAAAYFTFGIQLTNAHNGALNNMLIRGKDVDVTSSAGIRLLGTCRDVKISNSNIFYSSNGIIGAGTSERCVVDNCTIEWVTKGVAFGFSAAEPYHKVINCPVISAFDLGIDTDNAINATFSGNTIVKESTSSSNWVGINLGANSDNAIIEGNNISGVGVGGTEDGIVITDASNVSIKDNQTNDQRYGIHLKAAATDCVVQNNDNVGATTQSIFNEGTDNIIENNLPYSTVNFIDDADTTPSVKNVGIANNIITMNYPGVVSITNFDDGYHQQIIYLYIHTDSANVTLVHGTGTPVTGIDLQGSANLVLDPKDMVALWYNATVGVWTRINNATN
jgi:parallel beta-helix repeat protein